MALCRARRSDKASIAQAARNLMLHGRYRSKRITATKIYGNIEERLVGNIAPKIHIQCEFCCNGSLKVHEPKCGVALAW